ncbi:MAG: type II secretion system secretin GspD [Deltaproteobacteria bacterium]|nr:type II secretion system secretin GspD [Deltaproteobacteria bacterium]
MKRAGMLGRWIVFIAGILVLFTAFAPPALWAKEVKEVALDFDDVDIRLFIRVISELTGKNFIVDNNVRGKVTVLSPKKLTTQQAYDVFKSVLAVNGFTVVETGEVTKIIPAQNISGYGLPLSTRKIMKGDDEFVTQIMPLKYLDARTLQPLIKPLLSRLGTILATPSSDILIVTDYRSNIKKIDALLDEIDIQVSEQVVERLDLKYTTALDASRTLTEILEARYGKSGKTVSGSRQGLFKIVPVERINALIVVASADIFMDIRSVLSKIDRPTPEGKSMLNVYYLENAKAEEIVNILTQTQKAMTAAREGSQPAVPEKTEGGGNVVAGKFRALGKEITITADKGTNSLIIYAKPDDYNAIKEMIKKLDIPRKQVFIQALIMEVSPNEDFSFGSEWSGFRDVGHPFSDDSRTGVFIGQKQNQGPLENLTASGGQINLGQGFSLGMLGESVRIGNFTFPSLEVMIKAVETLDTTNILSKPQLVTLNNETATINISTNRPFQTSSTILEGGGTSQNIEYRDVGIKLKITPHVNEKGKIRLEINQEVSKLSGTVTTNQPVTLKRAIDTVVEVHDGETLVIGGLIEEQRDFTKNTVPCLGGLPFVGWGFKSVGLSSTKTNLLVFISPRIISSPAEAAGITREKENYMKKIREQQEERVKGEEPFFRKDKRGPGATGEDLEKE